MIDYIEPQWDAPMNVRALTTLRTGGFSKGAYASFNLADHVGDEAASVIKNRLKLQAAFDLQHEPFWLQQVHGTHVIHLDGKPQNNEGDATFTHLKGYPCVVLTADCLPVLLCNRTGTVVAAIHAGWKGLLSGVIEATVEALQVPSDSLLAWMGPAIGPEAFEVSAEIRRAFMEKNSDAHLAFKPFAEEKWLGDIFLLGKQRLNAVGVTAVYGGYVCTYSESHRFFSFRRDKETGRMATLIWLQ